ILLTGDNSLYLQTKSRHFINIRHIYPDNAFCEICNQIAAPDAHFCFFILMVTITLLSLRNSAHHFLPLTLKFFRCQPITM
ncbi:hypothetical protein Q4S22_19190, partial [Morganella morganii]